VQRNGQTSSRVASSIASPLSFQLWTSLWLAMRVSGGGELVYPLADKLAARGTRITF
jgi:hypothetical protein